MKILLILISNLIFLTNIYTEEIICSASVKNDSVSFTLTTSTSVSEVKVVFKGMASFLGSDTINLDLVKSGSWSKTIRNIPVGFYYYLFLIDGAPVYDRSSFAFFAWGTWVNAFEISDPKNTFSVRKTGPFGNMNINYYKSGKLDEFRKCYVYTPSEYDNNPEKKYPVVYLLHDFGEDESAWLYQGLVNNIIDNGINDGIIQPMLVVLENINAFKSDPGSPSNSNEIDSLFISDLVPFIDLQYHTLDSAKYRTIGGCSLGGKIALDIAIAHKNTFRNLGIFSLPVDFDTSLVITDSLKKLNLFHFWLGAGIGDASYDKVEKFHEQLDNNGVQHEWDPQSGNYNWLVWRKNLYNMLQKITY